MLIQETTATPQKPVINVRLEKSLAYEMINDFGRDAYMRVISDYQANMIEKLAMLSALKDTGAVLWQLQSIRNCSAQLGVRSVVEMCDALKGLALKAPLSRCNLTGLWVTVDASIDELKLLGDRQAA